MYPIEFDHVHQLVVSIATELVARFFEQLTLATDDDHTDFTEHTDRLAEQIASEVSRDWNELTTAHQAENAVEEIYNASRTSLISLLNLQGGTVEFGPGDVQPLTDQRLGQSEAWDHWIDQMMEQRVWEDAPDPRS